MDYTQTECRQRPKWAVGAAIAATSILALLGSAAPAVADVVVTPTEATQGDAANLTLRITNESRTASIAAVEVQLPADTPIAEVYPLSVADWAPLMTNVKIDKSIPSLHGYQITDVTTAVKWVAMPGNELPPGGNTELYLSIGPLPTTVAQLSFGVVITNSDGTQLRWTGQPGASAAPGEHPAPVLVLKAGPAGQNGNTAEHGAGHGGTIPATTAAAAAAGAADTGDSTAPGGPSYGGWTLATLLFIAAITVFGLVLQRRKAPAPDPAEPQPTEEPDATAPDPEAPDSEAPDSEAPVKDKSLATVPVGPAP